MVKLIKLLLMFVHFLEILKNPQKQLFDFKESWKKNPGKLEFFSSPLKFR